MSAPTLLLSLTLAVAGAQSYAELKSSLPDDKDARAAALLELAEDDRPALKDRLRAAKALGKLQRKEPAAKLDTLLLELRLHGIGGAEKKRAKSLKRILKHARKHQLRSSLSRLERLSSAESAFRALTKRLKVVAKASKAKADGSKRKASKRKASKRKAVTGRGGKLSADDKKLMKAVRAGIPSWQRYDERRAAEASLRLLELQVVNKGARRAVLRRSRRLVEAGGSSRDYASIRVGARRLRARIYEQRAEYRKALEEHFAGDRADAPSPKRSVYDEPEQPAYLRSRATSDLCGGLREEGLKCEKIEEELFGERSFYDFAQEKRRRFSDARSRASLFEYQSLLHDCVQTSTQVDTLDAAVSITWWVSGDGTVEEHKIEPRRLDRGEFARCIEGALGKFRYPRFKGERREVIYDLDITG